MNNRMYFETEAEAQKVVDVISRYWEECRIEKIYFDEGDKYAILVARRCPSGDPMWYLDNYMIG
jgi:hypothetical protein